MNVCIQKEVSSPAPTLERLQAIVAPDLKRVDNVLMQHIESSAPLISTLASHIIASGGKRLRPALTLITSRLCGYTGERHIQLAACVEFIHTATLLHDDVVDESKLRRGESTANDLWGNKASVLVGDLLLSRAFQLMVSDGSLHILKILSDTSAIIAEGEVMQLAAEGDLHTGKETYLAIISAKTAALFAAACEMGAVVSGQLHLAASLREFGHCLGIAFQLVDDALDYTADSSILGKTVGDDFREGKITLPVIGAVAHATPEEKLFWKRTMEEHTQQADDLERAIAILKKYKTLETTLELAKDYCTRAHALLDSFAASPEKTALTETVDFCLARAY